MFWCSNCNGIGFGLIYLKSEDFSKRNHKRGLGWRVDFIKNINVYFAKFPKSWWLDCVLISLKKEDLFAKLSKIEVGPSDCKLISLKPKYLFLQNKRKKSQKLSAQCSNGRKRGQRGHAPGHGSAVLGRTFVF